jgi:hypothetical protein
MFAAKLSAFLLTTPANKNGRQMTDGRFLNDIIV